MELTPCTNDDNCFCFYLSRADYFAYLYPFRTWYPSMWTKRPKRATWPCWALSSTRRYASLTGIDWSTHKLLLAVARAFLSYCYVHKEENNWDAFRLLYWVISFLLTFPSSQAGQECARINLCRNSCRWIECEFTHAARKVEGFGSNNNEQFIDNITLF